MSKLVDPLLPVFVQLSVAGLTRTILLPPQDERVIVVGSIASADFRVSGRGVAPIQFHIERDNGAVCLIPAYGIGDLRVNAARAFGPTPLEEESVLEFGGARLDVKILDAECFADSSDSLSTGRFDPRELEASYSLTLPGDEDDTQLAVRPIPALNAPAEEYPTAEFERAYQGEVGAAQHTERMAPYRPAEATEGASASFEHTRRRMVPLPEPDESDDELAFTLNGTQIMAPFQRPAASAATTSAVVPPQPSAEETVRLLPLRNTPRPETRPWQPPITTHVETPPREGREGGSAHSYAAMVAPHSALAPVTAQRATHRPERSALRAPEREGTRPPPLPPAKRVSWVTRLGLMTKARPLVVAGGASVGAVVLALLLLTATRLTARHALAATERPPKLVTALNSLRPASASNTPAQATLSVDPPEAIRSAKSVAAVQSSLAKKPALAPSQRKALY